MRRPGIFLSHSHKDKPFVHRLANDLLSHGVRVWIDDRELLIGDSLISRISSAIDEMDFCAAIISRHSIESPWVHQELAQAMNAEIERQRVKVLPILIDDCGLPKFLTDKLYADFRRPERYLEELAKILRRLGVEDLVKHTEQKKESPIIILSEIPMKLEEGITHEKVGQYKIAVTCFQEVIRHHPDAWPAYLHLGICQIELGQYDEAIDSLKLAANRKLMEATVFYYLALAHFKNSQRSGRADELQAALRDCSRSIELKPYSAAGELRKQIFKQLGLGWWQTFWKNFGDIDSPLPAIPNWDKWATFEAAVKKEKLCCKHCLQVGQQKCAGCDICLECNPSHRSHESNCASLQ